MSRALLSRTKIHENMPHALDASGPLRSGAVRGACGRVRCARALQETAFAGVRGCCCAPVCLCAWVCPSAFMSAFVGVDPDTEETSGERRAAPMPKPGCLCVLGDGCDCVRCTTWGEGSRLSGREVSG